MVLVGIPVWHSRPTLTKTLDSLVAQTKKMFLVTLSVDADGEDYSDIVEEYKKRGLKISTIYATDNGGPGVARQRVIDNNTMCDYIMFCDADDMLMPRAIEVLYREAKKGDYDVLASAFIREDSDGSGFLMKPEDTPCTWCFTAGTPVLTENGYKPIEELKIGEMVYTKDGSLQPITNIMSHEASNIVSTKVSGALEVTCTDNHKFYLYDKNNELYNKPLKDIEYDEKLSLAVLPNNRTIHINPKLAYIIGRYVGDGWKTIKKEKYFEYFLCSSKEEHEELKAILDEANISYGLHKTSNNSCPEITLHKKNKELIKYIDDCGRYAVDKHFPVEFLKWDNESLKALLEGYLAADGSISTLQGNRVAQRATTISKRLALEVALIARTLGFNPTYSYHQLEGTKQKILNKTCNRHDEYEIHWYLNGTKNKYVVTEGDKSWTNGIKLTQKEAATVYNITVDNNHSYIAGDFIVSNCHGKIYKAAYLNKYNIRFLPNAPLNEDAYFNVVAWNAARNKGYVHETTYLWRYNSSSVTRAHSNEDTFRMMASLYIYTQVKGLIKLNEIADPERDLSPLIGDTIINIYYHIMRMNFLNMSTKIDRLYLSELGQQQFIKDFLQDGDNWIYMGRKVNAADRYDDVIYFYKTPLNEFITQYIYQPDQDKLKIEDVEKWKLK